MLLTRTIRRVCRDLQLIIPLCLSWDLPVQQAPPEQPVQQALQVLQVLTVQQVPQVLQALQAL